MTQPAEQFDDANPPDWESLAALSQRVEQRREIGALTRDNWRKDYADAKTLVNGHDEFLECILIHADPEWLEDL